MEGPIPRNRSLNSQGRVSCRVTIPAVLLKESRLFKKLEVAKAISAVVTFPAQGGMPAETGYQGRLRGYGHERDSLCCKEYLICVENCFF